MAIDTTNQEQIRKLTLKDLVADAVERKDKAALRWLEDESGKQVERKKADGTTFLVNQTIVAIRAAYLRQFLGYVPTGNASSAAAREKLKAKKAEERSAMFAEAFKLVK